MTDITKRLFELQDIKYQAFSSKLMPTVDSTSVIGVRIPLLKKLANEFSVSNEAKAFLKELPHRYFEENNLHAFIICGIKDFNVCIKELERFLPFVDNWATCDSMRPVCFAKNKQKSLTLIDKWLKSDKEYTVRFAIEMLMVHFLDEDFKMEYAERIARVTSDKYYINMMIAWYFATALSKHWDEIFPFIENKRLSPWIHAKTIQKAIESYRITTEQKEILRRLK